MIFINETIQIPDEELEWSFARSGGPGGQNVNKVASKATLRWNFSNSNALTAEIKDRLQVKYPSRVTNEGELVITSQKTRDQDRNKQDCLEKLREIIRAVLVIPKPRKKTKPTKASKARRVADKRHKAINRAKRQIPDED
ncbi:MAG: alternative ribosome rescue aminoacyl-tRNA hydrolase ArfB [Gemmataceae bacterium]|jgi:ribosome-associated protein|nr:alternative ribosome rescue aminoacyl-tRNA hydrolase ArfB [Gemmataceae bacterium]